MQKIPASVWTLVAGVLVTLVSLWVGQHHGLLPEQVSAQAPLVDGFFNIMMTIATALFLVVEGAIVIFAIKFRRRPGDDTDGIPIEGNVPLEILWTAIPAVIVFGLGTYSVQVYEEMGGFHAAGQGMMAHHHVPAIARQASGSAIAAPLLVNSSETTLDLAEASSTASKSVKYGLGATPENANKPADLVVDVLGMQYAWIFTYPDRGVTSGELHIPLGKDVQLNLSAQDVIHSFWLPQFRLKQDAIPGQPTELRFVATKVGTYPVVCAELCGGYHGSMRTQVVIHSPEEFEAWLTENQVAQQMEPNQLQANQAIATNPASLTPTEFLAPYASAMGIKPAMLNQLH
jgi:cytochrome c oxidase subunit 2